LAIDLGILDRKELREEFEAVVRRSQEPPDLFTNCGSIIFRKSIFWKWRLKSGGDHSIFG